jgi:hypothetical protein
MVLTLMTTFFLKTTDRVVQHKAIPIPPLRIVRAQEASQLRRVESCSVRINAQTRHLALTCEQVVHGTRTSRVSPKG